MFQRSLFRVNSRAWEKSDVVAGAMVTGITSFEAKVLSSLVEGDPEEVALRDQVAKAQVSSREHTGVGLFVKFLVPPTAVRLSTSNRYIEQTPKTHLEHPKREAGALLWFQDGWLATLECYVYDGVWAADETLFRVLPRAERAHR
jgi:hypothetical protein